MISIVNSSQYANSPGHFRSISGSRARLFCWRHFWLKWLKSQAPMLVAFRSEIIEGGLKEPARHMLPLPQADTTGGQITFTMAVDPVKSNYFTAKFWGSDAGEDRGGLNSVLRRETGRISTPWRYPTS